MANATYKKKIEAYVKDRASKAKNIETSKGLLAPKETMNKPMGGGAEQDPIITVGEFVYALRQKRAELQTKRSKK